MAEGLTHTSGPDKVAVASTSAPPASPPGYELLDEIGHGGMGVVYRARDVALDRDVAVKLLSERYPAGSPAAQRFLSEARITGQLQHPSIPAVHQVGTLADGRPFLAMKLIKGSTLEVILKRRTGPSQERGRLLAIFEAVCQAVGYAHAHRVIHRDLKPANVMVGAFGEVQVMDWGLAKVLGDVTPATADALAAEQTQAWTQVSPTPDSGSHTQAGSLIGTPAFIPPEQAGGEIERVNERSDVFGLGALLTVILTGQPPYVGETFESVRVQALRGKLEDCFARLDASGAEPELVALCKQCLAFEPAQRSADAGAVAQAVTGLRAAAEERARTAEREQAAAAARSAERRKRRQLWLGAATALALAVVAGLAAVLAVQARARHDLEAKNAELAAQQVKLQARFDMAMKAIALLHTGVSEDMLLKNAEFKELRTKLFEEAAGFYADLEKLLAGQIDAKSRKTLAEGYFQLAELTDKIGDKNEALRVHRKALALRRELATAEAADGETPLDVARSLNNVAELLITTGDFAGARAAWEEERDLAERLEAKHPTDAVRGVLAQGHHGIGNVLWHTGKFEEALLWYRKALAIRQKLADANPGVTEFQMDLAQSHNLIGWMLSLTGKPEPALTEASNALVIRQKLADANPAVPYFQNELAWGHNVIGSVLWQMGKFEEALTVRRKQLAIWQKLADFNPAVTDFQHSLVLSHTHMGIGLRQTGKPEEAITELRKAVAIGQKLADANPAVPDFLSDLRWSRRSLTWTLAVARPAKEAIPLLATELAADPGDTLLSLQVAALQAWLGPGKELAATLERIRAVAKDTKEATTAERAAKACSILPSASKAELDAALALARKGVELDKDGKLRERTLLALGMAEYRSGHYAAAQEPLVAAAKAGPNDPQVTGIAAFYRAMSLFRQGKKEEARKLALTAAAKMKPLPKDEQNRLANAASPDDLILWLAYHEAKAMIKFDEKKVERAP